MSPSFFFTLLALLFCQSLVPAITVTAKDVDDSNVIQYSALGENMATADGRAAVYGQRRLLHDNPVETILDDASILTSATVSGVLIKAACQDNALDYLGKMCSTLLQSAPVTGDPRSLAIFTLHETGKLLSNTTVNASERLAAAEPSVTPDVSASIKVCASTLYPQAQHQIYVAIFQLASKGKGNVEYKVATQAVMDASAKVRTCYFDLSSKRFLKGEDRLIVNEINGQNQLIKKMLAAAWNLVINASNA